MDDIYGPAFFRSQQDQSRASAGVYAELFFAHFEPQSVVDVGCGVGSWLDAFSAGGAKTLGIDGDWVDTKMLFPGVNEFLVHDLDSPLTGLKRRFDLAISVEVAEHLVPSSSESFVESLTMLSDTVIFGAAIPNQGGTNHINERNQSFWASLFIERGYEVFDFFRPSVFGHDHVAFWYQQNTFLYVRARSEGEHVLRDANLVPLSNVSFMDAVHPKLFSIRSEPVRGMTLLKRVLPRYFVAALVRLREKFKSP